LSSLSAASLCIQGRVRDTYVQVFAWTEQPDHSWHKALVHNFDTPVWRLSWRVMGSILAASDGSGTTTLWKEAVDHKWQQLHK